MLPVYKACWIDQNSQSEDLMAFLKLKQKFLAFDKNNQLVFLADSKFTLSHTQQKFPKVKFHFQSEFDAD